jgi:hypothetical protein
MATSPRSSIAPRAQSSGSAAFCRKSRTRAQAVTPARGHVDAVPGRLRKIARTGHGRHALAVETRCASGEVEEHVSRGDHRRTGGGPRHRQEVLEHQVEQLGGEPLAA